MMFTALHVRLYPTAEQKTLIDKTFGCCRLVYNTMLARRKEAWSTNKEAISKNAFMAALPATKKKFPWLAEVDSTALQQAINDMDTAYTKFYKGSAEFPRFHSKHGRQSFRVTMGIKIEEDRVKPGKLGLIKCKNLADRYNGEKIKNVTISRDIDGRYYASILIEKDTIMRDHCHEFKACGIDVGVAKPLTIGWEDNSGKLKARHTGIAFTHRLAVKEERRKRYQRQLARKQKGSAGFKRAKRKVARAFAEERHYREDWHKKTAHYLCSTFTEIHFEDLNIKGMTKAVQPNADGIRKGHAAKAGLNRELLRMGFSALMTRVHQKAEQYGTKVVFVDRKHTSQCCSDCGHIEKANRKTQSRFECVACGFRANADKNASWNILRRQGQSLH